MKLRGLGHFLAWAPQIPFSKNGDGRDMTAGVRDWLRTRELSGRDFAFQLQYSKVPVEPTGTRLQHLFASRRSKVHIIFPEKIREPDPRTPDPRSHDLPSHDLVLLLVSKATITPSDLL